ncbi:MAG: tryptophanase [Spirochaetaceae bacterium]|nr:tryptophanase [Spirochaetaceae bacterium]
MSVKFRNGENIPLEMHKTRVIQRLNLLPIEERLKASQEAGNNTFLLRNRDVFLDMLTDSGTNAMSQAQYAAMLDADDAYAGSETFYRLEAALKDIFGTRFFLPAHQGRACENIICQTFVKPGQSVLMNYHFTTTKAHIMRNGGSVVEIIKKEGLEVTSDLPFKGNLDIDRLRQEIETNGAKNIAFLRIEAGTNLVGGQPVSMANMREAVKIAKEAGILTVFDASLLSDNLYFIKVREKEFANKSLHEITLELGSLFDLTYFSARKLGCARGGGMITNREDLYNKMIGLVPLYEGFLTYGGMSVREMEALAIGLRENLDIHVIEQTPVFVEALVKELVAAKIPVVTPAGGLGCHVNAMDFCDHLPLEQYRAGALAIATYIASGVRGMERGTLSEVRKEDGSEHFAEMELLRLAVPKRVFSLSQIKYVADRLTWLHENRHMIGGLRFTFEPAVLRFFFGRLEPVSDWPQKLAEKFRKDFGNSL